MNTLGSTACYLCYRVFPTFSVTVHEKDVGHWLLRSSRALACENMRVIGTLKCVVCGDRNAEQVLPFCSEREALACKGRFSAQRY
ncbi:uncharacterized protein SCHCODRAFT_02221737 [Schizophyllum commune H4-8]|uniref:uncharacterized protein n=1 Tax=Schizophyllum commune (strain H4-8 / FGSC 9210) TaxID=578458 RepID=UPI0021602E45|nr:uncharacterized protein SCHCODRAFT_02221737 [Schizophyllum commune H4-8]KAI5895031.1 hypothetical protein SCHCODRAFT_02221737 [Schizophyllum commune H4-8]